MQTDLLLQIHRHVTGQGVTSSVGSCHNRNTNQQWTPVVADNSGQAKTCIRIVGVLFNNCIWLVLVVLKRRGLRDASTQVHRNDAQRDRGQERNTPTEILHGSCTIEVSGHPGSNRHDRSTRGKAQVGTHI